MAPSRPKPQSKPKGKNRQLSKKPDGNNVKPRQLLQDATARLEQGDPMSAAKMVRTAYEIIGDRSRHSEALFVLMGQIHVELGEMDEARSFFLKAVEADDERDESTARIAQDDEDVIGAAEKYLWLAQLSEEGGHDSAAWYEKGASALRTQLTALEAALESRPLPHSHERQKARIEAVRRRLAETLCAVTELYMTDLSWDTDAEVRCETLVTEAVLLAPELPDAWQTLASVRISQDRPEDARAALVRGLDLWEARAPEDPLVPPFPSRVSLLRLLIEVQMEEKAIDVADRLVAEDDSSVEAWYLGGFATYNLGERIKSEKTKGTDDDAESWRASWRSSRRWLTRCLELFVAEEYEDERLGEHAKELLASINEDLGQADDCQDEEDEEWEYVDGDEDEEME